MREQKKWTERENKILISAIKEGHTASEIAKTLGRSEKSIRRHSEKLQINVVELKAKQNAVSLLEVDVKCPFFQKLYRGKSIKCEGLTPSGYISLGFGEEFHWKNHVIKFCNKDYKQCPFYELLNRLYEK